MKKSGLADFICRMVKCERRTWGRSTLSKKEMYILASYLNLVADMNDRILEELRNAKIRR